MEKAKIIVRKATRGDAEIIARAVALAIGDPKALKDYCGEDHHGVLMAIASHEGTQYSWQYALVAEIDEKCVGAIVGYDGVELRELRNGTFEVLKRCIGRVPNIPDETQAGEYYLDSIGVLPEFRGQGVGRALIAAFCDKAFAEGHERIGLIVDQDNPKAESLYTSLGFERVGTFDFFGHMMWHMQRKNMNRKEHTISAIPERTDELIEQLTEVWEASVRATHHFLSEEDICEIKGYVPEALKGVPELIIATEATKQPVAFMGIDKEQIEMLFIAPNYRGSGIGRKLIEFGIANYNISKVTVNEQNPQAIGFYTHMGFEVFKRSERDEQGRPFPLLYMRL